MSSPAKKPASPAQALHARWAAVADKERECRARELPAISTSAAFLFDSAFKAACRDLPPRRTSGLVELQRLFHQKRKAG